MSDDTLKDIGNPVNTVDGKPIDFPLKNLDADTIKGGGKTYRLQGFNAPETAKMHGNIFIPNQMPNDLTQEYVNKFATEGGYTALETVKRDPSFPNRVIARQFNPDNNDDLGSALIS